MIRNNWRRRLSVASLDYCIVECAAYNTGTLVANCLDEKLNSEIKSVTFCLHIAQDGRTRMPSLGIVKIEEIYYLPSTTHLRLPDILVPRPGDKADLATGHEVAQRRLQVEEQQQHYILCSVVTVRRLNTKYKLIIANGCQHFELLCPESRPELIIDFTFSPFFV